MAVTVLLVLAGSGLLCARAQFNTNHQKEGDDVVNEVTRLSQTVSQLKTAAQTQETKIAAVLSNILSKLQTLSSAHDDFRKELAQLNSNNGNIVQEIAKLNTTLESDSRQRANLKSEVSKLNTQYNSLSNKLSQATKRLGSTEHQLNFTESRLDVFEDDLNNTSSLVNVMGRNFSSQLRNTRALVSQMEVHKVDVNAELNATGARIALVENGIDIAIRRLSGIGSHTLRLDTNFTLLKTEMNTMQSYWSRRYVEMNTSINTTKNGLATARMSIHSVSVKQASQEKTLLNIQTQQNDTSGRINLIVHDNTVILQKITSQASVLSKMSTSINTTMTELATARTSINSISGEHASLVSGVKTKFANVSARISQLTHATTTNQQKINVQSTIIGKLKLNVTFEVRQLVTKVLDDNRLKFDTVELNEGEGYDEGTGYFTVPVKGTYLLWITLAMQHPKEDIFISIYMYERRPKLLGRSEIFFNRDHNSKRASLTVAVALLKGQRVFFSKTGRKTNVLGQSQSSYGGTLLYQT